MYYQIYKLVKISSSVSMIQPIIINRYYDAISNYCKDVIVLEEKNKE